MTTTSTPFPPIQLPIVVTGEARPYASTAKVLAWGAAVVATAAPLVLVAAHAIAAPETFGMLAQNPIGGIQVMLGAVLWGAFAAAAARAISGAGRGRSWQIDRRGVVVTEHGRGGPSAKAIAMHTYAGLAHVVRTSLMGTTHELVLVGPRPGDDVIVRRAEQIGAMETAAVAAALGVAELPTRALYMRSPAELSGGAVAQAA